MTIGHFHIPVCLKENPFVILAAAGIQGPSLRRHAYASRKMLTVPNPHLSRRHSRGIDYAPVT